MPLSQRPGLTLSCEPPALYLPVPGVWCRAAVELFPWERGCHSVGGALITGHCSVMGPCLCALRAGPPPTASSLYSAPRGGKKKKAPTITGQTTVPRSPERGCGGPDACSLSAGALHSIIAPSDLGQKDWYRRALATLPSPRLAGVA